MINWLKRYCALYAGISSEYWPRIILVFISDFAGAINFFLGFYFVNVLHLTVSQTGMIMSCYGIGTAIGGVIGGRLSDKYNPANVSLISLFIKACCVLFFLHLKGFLWLCGNCFLLGIAAYNYKASNEVWILQQSQHSENVQLKIINALYAASNLGVTCASLMVGALAGKGFEKIFLHSSAMLIAAILFLYFTERKRVKNINVVEKKDESTSTFKFPALIIIVYICLYCVGLIMAQLSTTYSVYLQSAFPDYGLRGISFIFVLNSVLIIFFQMPFVNHFKSGNKLVLMGVGAFFYGFGMFLLAMPYAYFIAIISCILYTFGEMLFTSMAQLICYTKSPRNKKGQALGLYQSVYSLSLITGPILGSYAYKFSGKLVWIGAGMLGLFCLLLCLNCKNKFKF